MLKKLVLRNFQAHAKLEVQFGEGLTTIVGPTDAGKSAVLRALRWCCLNDIPGDAFVREGAKGCSVSLTLNTGDVVTRSKGGADGNLYELNKDEFRAFGSDVPKDIAQALKLSELNFQEQHDAPFWFSETAGEVSRQLNAVVDLTVIDTALAYTASAVRTAAQEVEFCARRVVEQEATLSQYAGAEDRKKEWNAILCLGLRWEETVRVVDVLSAALQRLEDAQGSIWKIPKFAEVEETERATRHMRSEVEDLDARLHHLEIEKNNITERTRILSRAKAEQKERLKGELCPICQKPM